MNIKEIVDKITAERQIPGRFPARIIFVRSFPDYSVLVDELSKVCDAILNIASFVQGDILPNFSALKRELNQSHDKQVLVLSLSEYLRLCLKRETNKETSMVPEIWATMQAESAKTKYIMPLFGGRELFDQVVPIIDERQKDFLWELTVSPESQEYALNVYSPAFATAIRADAFTFQEWLEKWDTLFANPKRKNFSLISKLIKYTNPTIGNVSVAVIDEPFSYLVSLISDGQKLKREWGDDQFWADIAKYVIQGEVFSATARFVLNMGAKFDPIAALARFDHMSNTERRLLWVWYKIYPSDDYYSFAIDKADYPDEIPIKLRDAIFQFPKMTNVTFSERASVLKMLSVQYGREYFSMVDKVLPTEIRLSYLTYRTLEECAYAVKTVSNLMRSGADVDTIIGQLRGLYPDLAEYLSPSESSDDEVSRYLDRYRQNKILNRLPEEWSNPIDFDNLDSRNKIMQQNGNVLTFWVDGLGAEWLPLLVKKLQRINIVATVDSNIGRALLPSETEYNRKWKDGDEKWDRLDKVSHNGIPDDKDYFLCIARQIEIIGEVAERVAELLKHHERVIVTGDHGSSRIAALMFHAAGNFAIDPPKNSIVRSFGRFCELNNGSLDVSITPSMEKIDLNGKQYIVMKTYEHFRQSGNAAGGNSDDNAVAGEVHGGMTPEEYLVPVIILTRKASVQAPIQIEVHKSKAAKFNDMGI